MNNTSLSLPWHWFVIIGTALTLVFLIWLLLANRKTSDKETTGHVWDGIEELDNPLPMWWVGMFVGSVVFGLAYLAYYPELGNFQGFGSWTSVNQHDKQVILHTRRFAPLYARLAALEPDQLMQDRTGLQVGRRLFINQCASCHGLNGAGARGFPNLTDQHWIWGGEFETIKHSITNGRMAQMPPWGAALGELGVLRVANHVLELAGREHNADLAAAGELQFQTMCVACHGTSGKGNPLLGAPDLTNDTWLYGGSIIDISKSISEGRQGIMPAQTNYLNADKTHILAAYVKSLSQ